MTDVSGGYGTDRDAARTGVWVVLIYETPDYLLAAHGPYDSREAAQLAVNDARRGRPMHDAYAVEMFRATDVLRMVAP